MKLPWVNNILLTLGTYSKYWPVFAFFTAWSKSNKREKYNSWVYSAVSEYWKQNKLSTTEAAGPRNVKLLGPRTRITQGLQSLMGCILPRCTAGPNIVGSCCIRVHTSANTDATTPNIVDPVRLYIVLADNTNRVKEKFCTVMVVFVLVFYSPLDASGPWSIVGT